MNAPLRENEYTNAAAYLFAPLIDLKNLREELLSFCQDRQLKGSILLSPEGINLFVAGKNERLGELIDYLRKIPGLEQLAPKYSYSSHQPFSRMLVRLKKEIIAFGIESVQPAKYTSKRLPAKQLRDWLAKNEDVVLLDTRNRYEYKLGTFANAVTLPLDHFRDFPQVVQEYASHLKDKKVVTFCTGGIRCEKAAPFLEQVGFKDVYQLEGGILKYFEEVGGEHYEGDCFVFDQRVGLDPALHESNTKQCFQCLAPLTDEEQKDPRYVEGKSCPFCFVTPKEVHEERRRLHLERVKEIASQLPGSKPYTNERPITVPLKYDKSTLIEFLTSVFKHIDETTWRKDIESGHLVDNDKRKVDYDQIVRSGERFLRLTFAEVEPEVNASIGILYEDDALIIIDKPAPLPMHPCGRFNKNSLRNILYQVFAPDFPAAAHRLDANTTGLVAVARTQRFARRLQSQFALGEVGKEYWARVRGVPEWDNFVCDTPISDEVIELGARRVDIEGKPARTEFTILKKFEDGSTLLKCVPITGRTNQIRLHLQSMGFPIVGDKTYVFSDETADSLTQKVGDEPLCLRSMGLTLKHPVTNETLNFTAPAPEWASI